MKIDLSLKVLAATTAVLLTGALASTQAALVIVQPTAATLTTAGGSGGNAFVDATLTSTINGYGFEYNPLYTPTVGNGTTFDNGQTITSTANTAQTVYPWFTIGHYQGPSYLGRINGSASGFNGSVITFDLSQKSTLNGVFLWNYAEEYPLESNIWYNNRGLKNVTISLYNDLTLVNSQTVNFSAAATNNAYSQAEYLSLTESVNVNHVTFTINTNQADATSGYVGFGEVRFTAIPEPTALALIGLATAGMILRRRRK